MQVPMFVVFTFSFISGAPMPQYRIYSLGPDGKISGPAEVVECADEQDAIDKASQAANGKAAELWEGARFIAYFPSDEPDPLDILTSIAGKTDTRQA
jgi:hypothetical protein